MQRLNQIITNLGFYYFIFLCAEVFLMGSGQEVKVFGPVSLRMLNFAIAASAGILVIFRQSIPSEIAVIIVSYTIIIYISMAVGFLNGSDNDLIMMDVKMFLALFAFPFFYYGLKTARAVEVLFSTFVLCMKVMIMAYIFYMVVVYFLKLIPFNVVWLALEPLDSFRFRGTEGALFYKGFLFMPIASVAFLIRRNRIWLILSAVAIFLTYTRGFYVIFFMGIILNYMMSEKVSFNMILGLGLLMLCIYVVIDLLGLFEVSEARQQGDTVRWMTFQQVWDEVNPISFLVGHGFGHGVPIRKEHMEMSFLEIFHKQGLIGFIVWFILFYRSLYFWKNTPADVEMYARFFVIALVLVYIQSLFNPYLTNAIGISMVMLSYLSCYRLFRVCA